MRRKTTDREESAEVQVLGEDHLPVPARVLQDHAIGGIGLADVDPVSSLVTCSHEEVDSSRAEVHIDEEPHAEIGISISSTRHAA